MGAEHVLKIASWHGHCFICLAEISPSRVKQKRSCGSSSSFSSLHYLYRYLGLNVEQGRILYNGKVPPWPNDSLETVKTKMNCSSAMNLTTSLLCEECAPLNERFSKVYRQLERKRIEVTSCLKEIHAKLVTAEETGMLEQFQRITEDANKNKSNPDGLREELQLLEELRTEALLKCSSKIASASPRVKLGWIAIPTQEKNDGRPPNPEEKISSIGIQPETDLDIGPVKLERRSPTRPFQMENDDGIEGVSDDPVDDDEDEQHSETEETVSHPKNTEETDNEDRARVVAKENILVFKDIPPPVFIYPSGFPKNLTDNKMESIQDPSTGMSKCSLCPREFKTAYSFRVHYRVTHIGVRHKCILCQTDFASPGNYRKHYREVHMATTRDPERNKCRNCAKIYYSESGLRVHRKSCTSRNKTGPPPPSESEPVIVGVQVKTEAHQKKNEAQVDLALESKSDVKESGEIPPSIIVGPSGTITDISLSISTQHYIKDPSKDTYKCRLCRKKLKNQSSFRWHYRSAHLKVHYRCPTCLRDFNFEPNYFRHYRTVHILRKYLKCSVCSKIFHREDYFLPHQKRCLAAKKKSEEILARCEVDSGSGKHKCRLCSLEFGSPQEFQKHYETIHRKCKLCGEEFLYRTAYARHCQSVHGINRNKFGCPTCSKVFTFEGSVKIHQRVSGCGGRKKRREKGVKHVKEVPPRKTRSMSTPTKKTLEEPPPPPESEPIVESVLTKELDPTGKQVQIQAEAIPNEGFISRRKVPCKIPPITIYPPGYEHDLKTQCGIDPLTLNHKCKLCDKEVPSYTSFRKHFRSAHVTLRYKCPLCGLQFKAKESYFIHHQSIHLNIPSGECGRCGKSFLLKSVLDHHQKICHKESRKHWDTKPDRPRVAIQPQSYEARKGILKMWSETDPSTGKVKCTVCAMEFQTSSGFSQHYKTIHLKFRYKCTLCGKEFSFERNYIRHHESVHLGKKVKCPDCNVEFNSKDSLSRHKRMLRCKKGPQPESAKTKSKKVPPPTTEKRKKGKEKAEKVPEQEGKESWSEPKIDIDIGIVKVERR